MSTACAPAGSPPARNQSEQEFRDYVGAPAALALNSSPLSTALVLGGIGPGDEVITTPVTFTATVAVIEHTGAPARSWWTSSPTP